MTSFLDQNPPEKSNCWIVNESFDGVPFVSFLKEVAKDTFPTITACKRNVRRGLLTINSCVATIESKVHTGDIIENVCKIRQCTPSPHENYDQNFALPVLWEDDYCAVVQKPAGIPVFSGHGDPTLGPSIPGASVHCALLRVLQKAPPTVPSPLHRPQPAHRLDRETGGLILAAKSRPALVSITEAFAERRVHKQYCALVWGRLDGHGILDSSLEGKSAITEYTSRCYFRPTNTIVKADGDDGRDAGGDRIGDGLDLESQGVTLVDLFPVTGRKHQLRRHMERLGHPIVGDRRYGGHVYPGHRDKAPSTLSQNIDDDDDNELQSAVMDNNDDSDSNNTHHPRHANHSLPMSMSISDMFLWSVSIRFPHPVSGTEVSRRSATQSQWDDEHLRLDIGDKNSAEPCRAVSWGRKQTVMSISSDN
eukprot:gene8889-18403_t